jgi:hypothetical protein
MQVTEEQFWPVTDHQNDIERVVKREHFPGGVKGPKQKQELEDLVRERIRKNREGTHGKLETNGVSKGIKRPADDSAARKGEKRVKLDYGFEVGLTAKEESIEDTFIDVISFFGCHAVGSALTCIGKPCYSGQS